MHPGAGPVSGAVSRLMRRPRCRAPTRALTAVIASGALFRLWPGLLPWRGPLRLRSEPGLVPVSRRVHIGNMPREECDARDGRGDEIVSGARRGLGAGSGEDLPNPDAGH